MYNFVYRLKWLPEQTLVCGTIVGNIIVFDGPSGKHKFTLRGHSAEIYDMCYSSRDRGNILITTSEDCTVKVFNLNSN